MRNRPLLWLIRQYLGAAVLWVGDKIQGDYRYEQTGPPDFGGRVEARPIPAAWDARNPVSGVQRTGGLCLTHGSYSGVACPGCSTSIR